MYRVYSGPRGSESPSPLDKGGSLYKEFERLDEAIGWAHHVKETGRVALLIEGDDGTRLDKQALAKVLHHREDEQAGRRAV
jgi:hypothetical protein